MEQNAWPGNSLPGSIPQGMEEQLPRFDQETALGGQWDWEPHTADCEASICLVHTNCSDAVVARIDEILDDGNLQTGDLVLDGDRIAFYISE